MCQTLSNVDCMSKNVQLIFYPSEKRFKLFSFKKNKLSLVLLFALNPDCWLTIIWFFSKWLSRRPAMIFSKSMDNIGVQLIGWYFLMSILSPFSIIVILDSFKQSGIKPLFIETLNISEMFLIILSGKCLRHLLINKSSSGESVFIFFIIKFISSIVIWENSLLQYTSEQRYMETEQNLNRTGTETEQNWN